MKKSMDFSLFQGFLTGERIALQVNRFILIGMIGCFVLGIVNFGQYIIPTWNGSYLPWVAMIIALEATYTLKQTRRARDLEMSVPTYRFVEGVVLLVLARLFLYYYYGWDQLFSDISEPTGWFINAFLAPEYLFVVLILLVVWILSSWFMNDLFEIESALALLNAEGYEKYFSNCAAIRSSLASRLLWIGMVMIAMVGLVELDIQSVFTGNSSGVETGTWYVFVYFALLILLLSFTYFSTMRAGWAWERIPLDRNMAGRWFLYVGGVLLLIGVVVSFLPTHYSLGFLSTLRYVIQIIVGFITSIIFILFFLFAQLISMLYRLFGAEQSIDNSLPPIGMPEMPEIQQAAERVSGSELLQSILFWVIFILIVGFAFVQYFRQNEHLLDRLREFSLWKMLEGSWTTLWGWLRGVGQTVGEAVQSGMQRLQQTFVRRSKAARFNFVNVRRLSPRQQVIFFYLALIRRGQEAGLTRKQSQTPREYQQYLVAHLPTAQDANDGELLDEFTQAFQEARYSQHAISVDKASGVKSAWKRLRQLLRQSVDSKVDS